MLIWASSCVPLKLATTVSRKSSRSRFFSLRANSTKTSVISVVAITDRRSSMTSLAVRSGACFLKLRRWPPPKTGGAVTFWVSRIGSKIGSTFIASGTSKTPTTTFSAIIFSRSAAVTVTIYVSYGKYRTLSLPATANNDWTKPGRVLLTRISTVCLLADTSSTERSKVFAGCTKFNKTSPWLCTSTGRPVSSCRSTASLSAESAAGCSCLAVDLGNTPKTRIKISKYREVIFVRRLF
mmetsp:Transcript_23621/g.56471  ORF Transcript_23621/g.56471 Transcript_23621/m.56471 type:complete len:238 (+) Transcript_23621:112-825(+)